MNDIDVPEPGDEIEMPRIDGPGWRTHRVTSTCDTYFIRAIDTSGMPLRFHCEYASWRYTETKTKKKRRRYPEPGDKIECCFDFRPNVENTWVPCTVVPKLFDTQAIYVEHAEGRGYVSLNSECWRWPVDKKSKQDVHRDLYNEILREKTEAFLRDLIRVRKELGVDDEP